MAQGFKRFIDVEIKKETALLSAAGFGTPLLLTSDVSIITTTVRAKKYLSLPAVEIDFISTTDEYKAARAYFSQSAFNKNQPEVLWIGVWDEVGAEDIVDAFTAIRNVTDEFYAVGITAAIRTETASLHLLATEIEAMRKVFIVDSNDADILSLTDTTSLAYLLREEGTSGFKRTSVNYHTDVTKYSAWAIMGRILPIGAGKSTMSYQILAGPEDGADFIEAAAITEVQKDNLFLANGNTTVEQSNQVFYFNGTMTGGKNLEREGEWFDIIRGIDFLQARIEEGLLSLLLEKAQADSKVPFTDAGIAMVKTRLNSLLDTFGVQQGILVDGSIVISVPSRADTTTVDRDDRLLRDVDFTADLAGAIGKVVVRGKVRV